MSDFDHEAFSAELKARLAANAGRIVHAKRTALEIAEATHAQAQEALEARGEAKTKQP